MSPSQAVSAQTVALGISILLRFLRYQAEKCGDIITIKTNLGAFASYISKDCYPKSTYIQLYVNSIQILRLLSKPEVAIDGENLMIQLNAWFVS